jgi:hypothetical protein
VGVALPDPAAATLIFGVARAGAIGTDVEI